MEQIINYVNPELLVVSVVLYLVGIGLKKAKFIPDKFILLILGGIGIFLCMAWVLAKGSFDGIQDVIMGIFTAIVQGILVTGISTYANQIIKQTYKEEKK